MIIFNTDVVAGALVEIEPAVRAEINILGPMIAPARQATEHTLKRPHHTPALVIEANAANGILLGHIQPVVDQRDTVGHIQFCKQRFAPVGTAIAIVVGMQKHNIAFAWARDQHIIPISDLQPARIGQVRRKNTQLKPPVDRQGLLQAGFLGGFNADTENGVQNDAKIPYLRRHVEPKQHNRADDQQYKSDTDQTQARAAALSMKLFILGHCYLPYKRIRQVHPAPAEPQALYRRAEESRLYSRRPPVADR